MRHVGSQFLGGDEANRQQPLAAYWVLNGGRSVRGRGFEAFVRLNMLDNRYDTFGTFAPNGRVPGHPGARFLTPAPLSNVLVGLSSLPSGYPG